MSEDLSVKLALACNILAAEGHSDIILGHVSARLPGEGRLYMKPAGLGLEEVTPEDIIQIDLDGNVLAGSRKRHSEYPIHTEIYRLRPEACCVVHTHPPYATALGAAGEMVRPVSHEGVLFSQAPVYRETTRLIRDPARGREVALCLGGHRALLLQNHGVVVAGSSVEEAAVYAILLEKAARIQLLAGLYGRMAWSPEEEVPLKIEEIYHPGNIQRFFDYYARRLGREQP